MAKYYYNGVLFPEIPADVLAEYPYAWIHTNQKNLYVAKAPWIYVGNDYLTFGSVTAENRKYVLSASGEEWTLVRTFTDNGGYTSYLLWSSHDIYHKDSTEIYFKGSEPVQESGEVEPEDILYSIHGSTLTAIADQVRRISGVEGGLTPEQMESNLMNVTASAELPSAENFTFGTEPGRDWTEYGITEFSRSVNAYAEVKTRGYTFIANQAFAVLGLRYFEVNATISTNTLKLWDANGEQVRTATCAAKKVQSWGEVYFDEPLNVAIGEKYTVSMYRDNGSKSGAAVEDVTFNPRLTFVNTSSSDNDAFPNDNVSTYVVAGVDIIIGPVQAELPNDYQITRTTMDDIAEEVQRISGTETKMTVEQIQQELSEVILQEKTVTPSTEQQVITPDSGFYGISKVTVGAVEQTESAGSMFSTTAVGILPVVYKGTARSTGLDCTGLFETTASGVVV